MRLSVFPFALSLSHSLLCPLGSALLASAAAEAAATAASEHCSSTYGCIPIRRPRFHEHTKPHSRTHPFSMHTPWTHHHHVMSYVVGLCETHQSHTRATTATHPPTFRPVDCALRPCSVSGCDALRCHCRCCSCFSIADHYWKSATTGAVGACWHRNDNDDRVHSRASQYATHRARAYIISCVDVSPVRCINVKCLLVHGAQRILWHNIVYILYKRDA